MKLFTKEINNKLFAQYPKGNDLDNQLVVAKIFNPYGKGRWFLLNSDPQDPDYLWAIVQMGDIVEVGSVLRSELESIRVSPFRFPLERDLGFRMVNAGELLRGLEQGKFYKNGGTIQAARGMDVGRFYKDKDGKSLRYIGENGQGQLIFKDGEKVVLKKMEDFEEEPNERKFFGFLEKGGDLKDEFLNDMAKIHKEIAEITLVDGSKISGEQIRREHHKYEDGGFVEKTDEELKGMSDEELFEYLDAKAAYMKPHTRPLSSFKAKNFAARAAAIQFQNEGTSKLEANFPDIAKIKEQAEQDYQEGVKRVAQKRRKMLGGGYTSSFSGTPQRRTTLTMAKGGEVNKIKYETKIKSQSDDGKKYEKEVYANGILIAEMSARSERYSIPANLNYTNAIRTRHDFKIKEQGIKTLLGEEIFKNIKFNVFVISYNNKNFYISNNGKLSIKFLKDAINYANEDKMAMGGKVKFEDKVKAIKASLLKTKKVPKKVQKDYGKTYNSKEAEQSAKRIAGAMRKKEMK